jgi:GNAT superfamily N-acetyltransferase
VQSPEWLRRAEAVHRQLRPLLPSAYEEKMNRVFAGGGRMCVAAQGEEVTGVAVYRIRENTVSGLHLYVDDLVVDEKLRSGGIGKTLLGHLEGKARRAGCAWLQLDSGVTLQQAHRFYFREGMAIASFRFGKPLQ